MKWLNLTIGLFSLFLSFAAFSEPTPSYSLVIEGAVNKVQAFTVEDLRTMQQTLFEGVDVYCMSGELKDHADQLSGVPLKALIERVGLKVEKGKDLRKIAFIAKATDDYWVTFSYGEIFNQVSATPVLIYFAKNGKPLDKSEGAIALMPMNDERMGGRQVKWLESVEVRVLEREK